MGKLRSVTNGSGVASMARNLGYLLGGRAIYFLTRAIYVVILARVMGPQIYGLINYGMAWYLLFLPLTRLGLEMVLSREVGQDRIVGDRTAAVTLTLRIVSVVVVSVVYIVLSAWIEDDPATRLMVLVFSFALIGRSLALWTENVYTSYEINQYTFRQQAIFRPLEVVLCLLVIVIRQEALLVVVVHGLVWCLEAVYGLIIIRRHVFKLRLDSNLVALKRIFLQGVPLGVSMLLISLPSQGPLIFFRHIASAGESLGQLALAMQTFILLSYLPLAIGSVALPVLSRSAAREDGKDRVYAETMLRFSLLLGGVLAIAGTAFGPWATVQIFGVRYAQAGSLIGPALWLMIPWSAGHALMGVLMADKRDVAVFISALAGAVFFTLAISPAVLRYDAAGAIGAAAGAMSLTAFFLINALQNRQALDLRLSLWKPSLAVFSAVFVFYALISTGPLSALVGAYVMLAAVCWKTGCLTSQDMALVKQMFSRSFGGTLFPFSKSD